MDNKKSDDESNKGRKKQAVIVGNAMYGNNYVATWTCQNCGNTLTSRGSSQNQVDNEMEGRKADHIIRCGNSTTITPDSTPKV